MGIEPFLIASSLICVMSQRLVRRLCDNCKENYKPDPEMIRKVGLTPEQAKTLTFYKPNGCEECLKTGFKGRLAIFEIMEVDDDIAHLVVERSDAHVIKQKATQKGMTTLGQDGLRHIVSGNTTIEEVLSVAFIEEAVEIYGA